jgi:peptidoglycan glycosyltransferase
LTIAGHTLVEQNRPNDQQTLWSLTESLAWSLNVVFAQVGLQLGGDTLAEAARGWGWESDIPFDLPVETSRVSVTPGFLDDPVAVAETAFGQGELQATPLQMALVAAGIANHGEIMRPYLVASLAEPDGETMRETRPSRWRRGTGSAAADQTTAMMVYAVENGALGTAFVPGYTIGGKTGTAETGRGDPHAWFIGFIGLPGEEPRYAVAVLLEAGGGGGQVALPIGRELLVAADGRIGEISLMRCSLSREPKQPGRAAMPAVRRRTSAMRVSLPERLHQGTDLLRTGTAAAPDDLEPFLPPATSVGDKLIGRWYGRPVPLVAQVGPPIRVYPER